MLALISYETDGGGEGAGFTSPSEEIDSIVVESSTYVSRLQFVASNLSNHATWRVYLPDNSIESGDTILNGSAIYDSLNRPVDLPAFLDLPTDFPDTASGASEWSAMVYIKRAATRHRVTMTNGDPPSVLVPLLVKGGEIVESYKP